MPGTELILRQNAQGTIFAASEESWDLFGVSGERLRGLRLTDLVAPRHHSRLLTAMADAMRRGVAEVDMDLRRGASVPVARLRIRALRGGGFRTALRPAVRPAANDPEPKKVPAVPMKADQLADVSHEIRTPLNAVIGFADALRQESFGPLGDRRYRDYAKLIQESGQHVLSLVNDLLDLSKAEANKLQVDAQPCRPTEVVESCIAMMRLEAERAGLTLRSRAAPGIGKVTVDQKILRQIVLNLLSNALKFTDRGSIVVRTRMLDGQLVVSVEDTGVGMSESDLERIGERFYQARQEGVRGAQGTGLGLSLSCALAKAHGGRLDIASKPGRGTTATLTLPARPAARRYEPLDAPRPGNVLPLPERPRRNAG